MQINGNPWKSVNTTENRWKSMETHENHWKSREYVCFCSPHLDGGGLMLFDMSGESAVLISCVKQGLVEYQTTHV